MYFEAQTLPHGSRRLRCLPGLSSSTMRDVTPTFTDFILLGHALTCLLSSALSAQTSAIMSVQTLPAELMLRILYYVDVPDLLAVSRVGKQQTCSAA